MDKKIKIKVTQDIYEKLKRKAHDSSFKNLENYVLSVIQDHVKEDHVDKYSPEEEAQIKERLKSLGYIE